MTNSTEPGFLNQNFKPQRIHIMGKQVYVMDKSCGYGNTYKTISEVVNAAKEFHKMFPDLPIEIEITTLEEFKELFDLPNIQVNLAIGSGSHVPKFSFEKVCTVLSFVSENEAEVRELGFKGKFINPIKEALK